MHLTALAFSRAFVFAVAWYVLTSTLEGLGQEPEGSNQVAFPSRRTVSCEGWTLHISELLDEDPERLDLALRLIAQQLREVVREVPENAVVALRKVPLWLSTEYPNTQPRAEYHPDPGWLREHHRDPAMAKGVEFTNIRIFEDEARRMPNVVLHELAHAYHDLILPGGFDNDRIRNAYRRAKRSGMYESVEQRFGDGRSVQTRAYAMMTPQEYFAESSEAFFSTNDFYPFNREQLLKHDPEFSSLLAELWGVDGPIDLPNKFDMTGWSHGGSLWINTTRDGADLAEGVELRDIPICIRLVGDTFSFSECQSDGADLRFSSPRDGQLLVHEIDAWDPEHGMATLWVRVPIVRGNERQELRLHWGNPNANMPAQDRKVFDASNGYVSVWHMDGDLIDSTGAWRAHATGTQLSDGVIGRSRLFAPGEGLSMGNELMQLPDGSSPHTTEAWVLVDRPNTTIVAWGNEKPQGKVVMQYRSPSRINMDCYFSGGNIATPAIVPLHRWQHVAYTYSATSTRIYINGQLVQERESPTPILSIQPPGRFHIGGWHDHYDFVGLIDEVRLSNQVRDPAWIRLQYENQKPNSMLVGSLVKPGNQLAVEPDRLELAEGKVARFTAIAEGAEKLSWVLHRDGREEVIETDRWKCSFDCGRIAQDQSVELRLNATYPDGVRSIRVPIELRNTIPDPIVSAIRAPKTWDGRSELVIEPVISNIEALREAGVDACSMEWTTSGVAVGGRKEANRWIAARAQGDGELCVQLSASNGGTPSTASTTIMVEQPPRKDADWVSPPASSHPWPRDGQFIPRDGWGDARERSGTLVFSGRLDDSLLQNGRFDQLIVRAFDGDRQIAQQTSAPDSQGAYSIPIRLPATLAKYRCELIGVQDGAERLLHRASDLLCGDVFMIVGQSNAVATDFGSGNDPSPSPWVRTFGTTDGGPERSRREIWGDAKARADGGELEVGYWGLMLGKHLAEQEKIPICIVNGAVGGTRIDQHQRNPANPTDVETIYGRLLWRLERAGLTHGVRGIFWHQGENDQGADGPSNRFGYETYEAYFLQLADAWKQDYPNVEHCFMFQIWPKSCAMGFDGSDDRLRDVQRRLPRRFSNLSIMSTLGITPPGGCHYPAEGYAQFAKRMLPLVEQKIYGRERNAVFTPPNLCQARWSDPNRSAIELEFDSPVAWNPACLDQFLIDAERIRLESGSADGNRLVLRLKTPHTNTPGSMQHLAYIDSDAWSQERLLRGINGIEVLTFCDVPIAEPLPQ